MAAQQIEAVYTKLSMAQRTYDAAHLACMNEVADIMTDQGLTRDLGSFLFAIHGIRSVRYGKNRSETQLRYEREEAHFAVRSAGVGFGIPEDDPNGYPQKLYMYPWSRLHKSIEGHADSAASPHTALRYRIVSGESPQQYAGQLVLPVLQTDFNVDKGTDPEVIESDLVVATITRESDSLLPADLVSVPLVFDTTIAHVSGLLQSQDNYRRRLDLYAQAMNRLRSYEQALPA